MIGVKNLDGMLGTDIFYNDGLLTAAAARPGEIGLITVNGLMTAPLGEARIGVWNYDLCALYSPGPGDSGGGSLREAVLTYFFCKA